MGNENCVITRSWLLVTPIVKYCVAIAKFSQRNPENRADTDKEILRSIYL